MKPTEEKWIKKFREMVYQYNRECKPLREVETKFLNRIIAFIRQTLSEEHRLAYQEGARIQAEMDAKTLSKERKKWVEEIIGENENEVVANKEGNYDFEASREAVTRNFLRKDLRAKLKGDKTK